MSTTRPAAETSRFIDPGLLARLGNLDLVSRRVVDGFLSGLHQTTNRGASTDFAEHRAYAPGDDIRRIDWRVFARTDRLYVKTFEAETNADVIIALDTSASMSFASGDIDKFDYARLVAATLTHLAARQRDRVGFACFDQSITHETKPAARHRDTILRTLGGLKAEGQSDLQESLKSIAERFTRRGIVIVISDFYTSPKDTALALEELRLRGHDVIALHILDPLERDLNLDQSTILTDLESGEKMPVSASSRKAYGELIDAHIAALKTDLGARRIDYDCFTTDQPLDHMLFSYLSARARLVQTAGRTRG